MGDATCKKCGEPIVWLKTKAGKNIPVDGDVFDGEIYDKTRHVCHFDTCAGGSAKTAPKQQHRPPAPKPEPEPVPEVNLDADDPDEGNDPEGCDPGF